MCKSRESEAPGGSESEVNKKGPAERGAHVCEPGTCQGLPLVKLSKRWLKVTPHPLLQLGGSGCPDGA